MKIFLLIASLAAFSGIIVISVLLVVEALKKGKTRLYGWPEATLKDTPKWFWLCVAIQGSMGIICLATLIMVLIE